METKNIKNILEQSKAFFLIVFVFLTFILLGVFGIKYIGNYVKDTQSDEKVYDFILFKKFVCESAENKYIVSAENDWEFDIVNGEYYFKKNDLLVHLRNCNEIKKN